MWIKHQNKTQAMLLVLDAEVTFDSVRWTFLYKVLEKFVFHKTFTQALQTIYKTSTATTEKVR